MKPSLAGQDRQWDSPAPPADNPSACRDSAKGVLFIVFGLAGFIALCGGLFLWGGGISEKVKKHGEEITAVTAKQEKDHDDIVQMKGDVVYIKEGVRRISDRLDIPPPNIR